MNNTKRHSNEAQTGVTDFTVTPGNALRAGGKVYRENDTIPDGILTDTDATRLAAQGVISANNATAEQAGNLTAGTAAEVIASLEGMTAEQLQAIADAENGRDKPRKTVVDAIEAAQKRLADAAASGEGEGEGAGNGGQE